MPLIRCRTAPLTALAGVVGVLSVCGTASGQPLSDRVQVDVGYFLLDANAVVRFDALTGPAGEIDFARDLGIDQGAATFWLDVAWRAGRRHQVRFTYTKFDPDQVDVALQRGFTLGGRTFDVALDVTFATATDILGGYYRFAAYRNDRFEVGPTVGAGYLWLDAQLRASATIAGLGGLPIQQIDETASVGSVTGALGGYAKGWLASRLAVQADYLYLRLTPDDSQASISDWRVGATYYFVPRAGAGVQYKHYTYSYDRGTFDGVPGGEVTYGGLQVFASFLF